VVKEKNYYTIMLIVVLALSVVVLLNVQRTSKGFSEVYFENLTVPDYIVPNETYTLVFVIESHEVAPTKYNFEVYVEDKLIKQGEITLEPEKQIEVPFEVKISEVRYKKMTLSRQSTTYYIDASVLLAGNQLNFQNLPVNFSDSFLYFYTDKNNLTFILNASKNLSITSTNVVDHEEETIQFSLRKIDENEYKLTMSYSRIKYISEPVNIRILVKSSKGKVYQLGASIEVEGEK